MRSFFLSEDSSGFPSLHKVEQSSYPFCITNFANKSQNQTIKAHFLLMLCFLFLSLSLAPPVLTQSRFQSPLLEAMQAFSFY